VKPKSPLAGKIVKIISGAFKGCDFQVEDWWENVSGKSWMFCQGNPACLEYAIRAGLKDDLPTDDEVLYGKIGGLGKLIHISEIKLPKEVEK